MVRLTTKAKEALVQQVLNRDKESVASIAKRHHVGYSTLQKWVKRFSDTGTVGTTSQSSQGALISREEQFNHIVATHHLDALSLGKYCREHGLYSHQLQQWRITLMNPDNGNKKNAQSAELKQLKIENKRLQKELRRKEKALAEASALLIMKKKADLIWGGSEDGSCL